MNDLLALIGRDTTLRRTCARHGGEYSSACPLCGCGTDRFKVWPAIGRWACLGPEAGRAGCDRGGDAIQYLRERDGLSYAEACRQLGIPTNGAGSGGWGSGGWGAGGWGSGGVQPRAQGPLWPPAHSPAPAWGAGESRPAWSAGGSGDGSAPAGGGEEGTRPPNSAWQGRAAAYAAECAERLWQPEGAAALAWLHGRGLGDAVLRDFGIGYQAEEVREPHAAWGLQPPGGGAKEVWLPRGITIPWSIGGVVWRLNVRRPLSAAQVAAGQAKYIGPAGFGNALYNADALLAPSLAPSLATGGLSVVLVEGEFDALTVVQACADMANPPAAVATGSTAGARRMAWVARLALARRVLVAFDRDEAGEKAAAWWLGVLPEARRWLPCGHDVNAQPDGALVRAWVEEGLAGAWPPAGSGAG